MKSLYTTSPTQHLWTSGICCCWPDCLELFHEDMRDPEVLRTVTDSLWRRFYLRSTSVCSALEVFTRMRYINQRLTFDKSLTLQTCAVTAIFTRSPDNQQCLSTVTMVTDASIATGHNEQQQQQQTTTALHRPNRISSLNKETVVHNTEYTVPTLSLVVLSPLIYGHEINVGNHVCCYCCV